jgi:DNA-binding cell septation regulator SpoVG
MMRRPGRQSPENAAARRARGGATEPSIFNSNSSNATIDNRPPWPAQARPRPNARIAGLAQAFLAPQALDPQREHSRIRLLSFKPVARGALRGFATVQLPIGLTIEDCHVLVGQNGAWARLPSRPMLDRDGRQLRVDGKPQFANIIKWQSRDLADRFSAAVIEAITAVHPDALDLRDAE